MPVHSHLRPARRWLLMFSTVALLALGIFTRQHLAGELSIGTGPAGPAVAAQPFASHWSDHAAVLLALGDSVTAGYGATPGHGYVARLATTPANDAPDMLNHDLSHVFPHLTLVNHAVSGSTSFDLVERQIPRLTPFPADIQGVVVITSGGNDLIHHYGRTPPQADAMYGANWDQAQPWITGFTRRLDVACERIALLFPGGCEIFIASIYDPTDGIGDIEHAGLPRWPDGLRLLAAYNQVIADCVAKHPHAHLVDIHAAFLGHGIHCNESTRDFYAKDDPHYWYFKNLEDPNDRGYDAIRRLFLISMSATYVKPETTKP